MGLFFAFGGPLYPIANANETPSALQGMAVGDAHFRFGRFEPAITAWTQVLKSKSVSPEDRIKAMARRAEAYQALGHHDKAISDLRVAITEVKHIGNATLAATLQGSLGGVYLTSGALFLAQSELDASLETANRNNDIPLAARNMNNLGNLMLAQGDPFKAVLDFESGLKMAESVGEEQLRTIILLNLARASMRLENFRDARKNVRLAMEAFNRQDDTYQKIIGLISAARMLRMLAVDDRTDAFTKVRYETLQEATRLAEKFGDTRNLSDALGELARVYEEEGRLGEALILTRRALFQAQHLNAPELLYLWQWQLGRIYRTQGENTLALSAYRRSVRYLRDIHAELLTTADANGRSFRDSIAPVLLELVDLLIKESDNVSDPHVAQIRLREARSTLELFKTAELEDYFQDDCVSALQAKVKTIDKLADDTAAIYPIFLPDRIEILLSLPNGLSHTTAPIPVETVNEAAARFVERLQDYQSQAYQGPAQNLYDWLIAPIEPKLQRANISTLVFILDGSLRTVPMSSLYDGKQHLIEKYAIAVAPGLTLLDPKPLVRGNLDLLLSGLTRSVRGFSALPNVEAELNSIKKLHGGRLLMDQTFITDNLRTELNTKPFSVIHIASHAQFDRNPKKSFILTYDGQLDMDGLEAFIKLSKFRKEPVELLTLSACTTAEGDDRSALGLSGLAIKAGARSVLGSLWSIEDNSTAILMEAFYTQLNRPELSKAEALRQAQINLLRNGRYSHPFFWSAFILIGNWL